MDRVRGGRQAARRNRVVLAALLVAVACGYLAWAPRGAGQPRVHSIMDDPFGALQKSGGGLAWGEGEWAEGPRNLSGGGGVLGILGLGGAPRGSGADPNATLGSVLATALPADSRAPAAVSTPAPGALVGEGPAAEEGDRGGAPNGTNSLGAPVLPGDQSQGGGVVGAPPSSSPPAAQAVLGNLSQGGVLVVATSSASTPATAALLKGLSQDAVQAGAPPSSIPPATALLPGNLSQVGVLVGAPSSSSPPAVPLQSSVVLPSVQSPYLPDVLNGSGLAPPAGVQWPGLQGNYSALDERAWACSAALERVERAMFRNLSWEDALAAAEQERSRGCPDIGLISGMGGVDVFADIGGANATEESASANLSVWVNDFAVGHERLRKVIVGHKTVQWLSHIARLKGKREWAFGMSGDSTVRGFALAMVQMFAPGTMVLGGLARLIVRSLMVVEGKDFKLSVLFLKNWYGVYAQQVFGEVLPVLPSLDLFAWNIGQHCLWSNKNRKTKRWKIVSVEIQNGLFGMEAVQLDMRLPRSVHLVYVNTNNLCVDDAGQGLSAVKPGEGYLFNREGARTMNLKEAEDLKLLRRPYRTIDSFLLTDNRCNFTTDGNHFLPLDKFRVLSLLMEMAVWPSAGPPVSYNTAIWGQ